MAVSLQLTEVWCYDESVGKIDRCSRSAEDVWEYLQLAEERGQTVARKAGVKWSAQPIKYMFAAARYVVYIDFASARTIATARRNIYGKLL